MAYIDTPDHIHLVHYGDDLKQLTYYGYDDKNDVQARYKKRPGKESEEFMAVQGMNGVVIMLAFARWSIREGEFRAARVELVEARKRLAMFKETVAALKKN